MGAARQIGLDRVETPYVFFMDADDAILNNFAFWHLIHYLDTHPDKFGVIGWEQGLTSNEFGEKTPHVYKGSFTEVQTVHGLMCRTEGLREKNIRFAPINYVEDGLFATTIVMYDLDVATLPFAVYDHKTGNLTNNVYQEFGLYNELNDLYNLIKYLSLQFGNSTDNNIEENFERFITSVLVDLDNRWLSKDKREDRVVLDSIIGDEQTYWYIITYYILTICKFIPRRYLYKFVTSDNIFF